MSTQPHSRMPTTPHFAGLEPVEARAAATSPAGAPLACPGSATIGTKSAAPNAPESPPKSAPPRLKSFLEKTLTRTRPPHSAHPFAWPGCRAAGALAPWSIRARIRKSGVAGAWYRSGRTGRDRGSAPDSAADRRGRRLRPLRRRGRPGGGPARVAPQGMGNPGGLPQPPQAAGRPQRGCGSHHPGPPPPRRPDHRRPQRRTSRPGRKADGQHPGGMRPHDRGRAGVGEDPADWADRSVPPGDAQGAGDSGHQPAWPGGYGAIAIQQELGLRRAPLPVPHALDGRRHVDGERRACGGLADALHRREGRDGEGQAEHLHALPGRRRRDPPRSCSTPTAFRACWWW